MSDRIGHGEDGEAEREGNADEADPDFGKVRREHGAAASAKNQPEGPDEFGCEFSHGRPTPLQSLDETAVRELWGQRYRGNSR